MQSRVAVIGIILEDTDEVEALNTLLHEYRDIVIGRMGIPYRERGINIISLAVDGSQDIINELTGKIGQLENVSVKTAFSSFGE